MPTIYKTMFSVSMVLTAAALVLFLIYGLNLGVDFTGGSLIELRTENPEVEPSAHYGAGLELRIIKELLEKLAIQNTTISQTDDGFLIKMPEISEETHQQILSELRNSGEVEEIRFDSIGPTLGAELKRKSIIAIGAALILISLYLAVVFSKVGGAVSPWVLALGAIIALFHDLILPVGVFAWLGKFKGVAIDPPLIAAALAILGYSINDTVVVYDRIRENLLKNQGADFDETVHKSIKQTLARSISTTLTTLFAVIAIYIFGASTLKNFSLALIIGISAGAYSSIFVASPILMLFYKK